MNQLHSLAFYALMVPAISLGASTALAQESTSSGTEQSQPDVQKNQDEMKSTTSAPQASQSGMQKSQAGMDNNGYMASAPMNGIHASDLMGVQVTTTGGDEVGPVSDLVIDQDGQVVGIVLGVGGFLGMGEKNVAIGWDEVSITGTTDELELQIDQSRDSLMSAPEFGTETQE